MCEEHQILLSDFHDQPFKVEKFKTQKKNIIERFIQFFADKERKKEIAIAAISSEIEKEKSTMQSLTAIYLNHRRRNKA